MIVSTNKITIQVNINVVDSLYLREWNVGIDVIHIESVLRHLDICRAQNLNAVGNCVHQKVLRQLEAANLVPANNLVGRNSIAIIYKVLGIILNVLVDVIREYQVNRIIRGNKGAELLKESLQSVPVYPVI